MRSITRKLLVLFSAFVALTTFSARIAVADSIVILDSAGVERATAAVDAGEKRDVKFAVDVPSGSSGTVEILLKNTATGEVFSATTSGGEVVFTGIPAGTYVVTSSQSVVFTNIAFGSAAAVGGGLGGAGAAAVGVGAVGAAGAIANGVSNSNDSKETNPSPFS